MNRLMIGLVLAGASLAAEAKTVRVSEFGYGAEDSTRFLQAALDSVAEKVVIDAKRWITLPLCGRSNQSIVFEDGAVVEAKRGEYLGKDDCVFSFICVSNVTICGRGEIRMHHDDYLKPPYKKAEWRHCINILGSDNIEVRDLRLVQGGGDGVYVGAMGKGRMKYWKVSTWRQYSSNIRLYDLYIDTHVRQGMSVTSCRGLVAERCVFKNTWGLPPQAGVDLEPNGKDNSIVGLIFRDCTFENNRGAGVEFALSHLIPGVSDRYDCLFERCRFVNDALVVHNTRPDHTQIGGKITVRDCQFVDPKAMPLAVGMMPDRPFEFSVSGSKIIEGGVETAIDDDWLVKNAPLLASGDRVPSVRVKADLSGMKVVDEDTGAVHEFPRMKLRNFARLAVYADRARKLTFRGGYSMIGRFRPKKAQYEPIRITDAAGKTVGELPMPVCEGKDAPTFSFDAPAAGFYFFDIKVGRMTFVLAAADAPVAIDLSRTWQDVIGSTGSFFFSVPSKAAKFGVFVSGDGGECVAAKVSDQSGKVVWRNGCVAAWAGAVVEPGAPAGLWTLEIDCPEKGGFEDERVDLIGIPGYLFFDSKRYWR